MTRRPEASEPLDELLIALNATADVPREALCRLARDERWLLALGRGRPDVPHLRLKNNALAAIRRQLGRASEIARREVDRSMDTGATVTCRGQPGYPTALEELGRPPPVLYIRGKVPAAPAISIVGSRNSDRYGVKASELFARELAGVGLTIVSGLAKGVDTAAHRGALAVPGGRTVAVLGCGIDIAYPRGSGTLAADIAQCGAVISEFPVGTPPLPEHFPQRNRVLAALGHGTLVVRATQRSGSLITARLALELGREIYALPGDVFDSRSVGPNCLIRDGATPVQHPIEILEGLPLEVQDRLREIELEPDEGEPPPEHLTDLYELLEFHGCATAEALAEMSGQPLVAVLALLTELEIGGWVERLPGSIFGVRH